MNVKYNATDLYCLLGDDYERIYSTLRRTLGHDAEVFAERLTGHGYLQWRVPGDGWTALSDCPPGHRERVVERVEYVRKQIAARFGANGEMATRVLSTPDESFVYYREGAGGDVAVCFAAWGYHYPERVRPAEIHSAPTPRGATERVTITIMRDGSGVASYPFMLNGHRRVTDANGSFQVGRVEIGRQFNVEVDGVASDHTVTRGEGDIRIYLAPADNVGDDTKAADDPEADITPARPDITSNDKSIRKEEVSLPPDRADRRVEPEKERADDRPDRDSSDKPAAGAAIPFILAALLAIISYIAGLKLIS